MNVQEIHLPWSWNRGGNRNWAEARPLDSPIGGLVEYDAPKNRYFVHPARMPWWEWFERELIFRQLLKSWPFIQGQVLEIGDGNKPFWLFFHHLSFQYTSVDFSEIRKENNTAPGDFDWNRLPLKPESLDTVVAWKVLRFFETPQSFLSRVHTSLKKEGRAIVLVPHGTWANGSDQFLRDFQPEMLRSWLQSAGFEIEFEQLFWGRGAFFLQKLNQLGAKNSVLRKTPSLATRSLLRLEKAYLSFWQKKNAAPAVFASEKAGQKPLASLFVGLKM